VAAEGKTMMKDNAGTLVSVGRTEDDQGRAVLRAIVDFYDGVAPDIDFKTVWDRTPVTIIAIDKIADLPSPSPNVLNVAPAVVANANPSSPVNRRADWNYDRQGYCDERQKESR
jgi:hypothetical protein